MCENGDDMVIKPFIPEDFGFILRSDYKPPSAPDHYERDSREHKIGPDEDWGRLNVFLTKGGDYCCIWYGAIDEVLADVQCKKSYGFNWTESCANEELFRGYITTTHEAEVILNALRLYRYRIELNLGFEKLDS
jgi:hypothetical protein